MIYALLKTDQETVSQVSPGQELPAPMLYDPEVHRKHREGQLSPLEAGNPAEKDHPIAEEGEIVLWYECYTSYYQLRTSLLILFSACSLAEKVSM